MRKRSANIVQPPRGSSLSSRRKILKAIPLIVVVAGCDYSPSGNGDTLLRSVQKFTDWVQMKVFQPAKLAPEYADGELTPEEGFRVNDYDSDEPDVDPATWTLTVDGLVKKPGEYKLADVSAFPKRVMNTRHCCVEGWSMIPKWGGTVAKEFLQSVGADLSAKYVSVECGDDYYAPYDMASFLHPQTLLCYEAYGKPLSLEHGAPLRIVMPTKLGYKSSKWITRLTVTNEKPGGYWEDQGYDWFAGI
jgi:DMSO/TMAO reductase YedYZ molybdopterin-dependent catalytic subunit